MRKLLFIAVLLVAFFGNAQDSIMTKISLKGRVYNIPTVITAANSLDDQQITDFSITSNILTLTLEDGGTQNVDLSQYLDNTDSQTVTDLSLSGNTLSITLSGGNTEMLDLSPIIPVADGSETIVTAGTNVTVTGSGTSGNPYVINSTASGSGTPDDDSVTPAKIANGDFGDFSVISNVASLDMGVVSTFELGDASVTQGKLANSAVNTDRVEDGSLWPIDLNISNTGTVGQVLSKSAANEFTWVDDQVGPGGSGSSKILDDTFTTDYTPVVADTFRLKYGKNLDSLVVSTPTGSYSDGDAITFVQDSIGDLYFDFKDIRKDVYYKTNNPGTIAMTHYTGTGWTFLCGDCSEYVPYTPPSNLYTLANAANPDNEVDATTGITVEGTDYLVTSEASPVSDGSFSIQFEKNTPAGTDASAEIQLSGLTVGVGHTITFDAYISTPGDANNSYVRTSGSVAADWSSTNQVEVNPDSDFVEYSFTSTPAVTNPRIQITTTTLAVNVQGLLLHIDNIRITETP
ncbi:hypothetical protein [Muricauda sp. MAR_2010_75]|uniref:hypothetical protein n=1 Tax=Allomuricauda sp. MAR_2010_75 TaxID=1250232 RepID=UPI00055B8286|nr:hypothetical protein [Muricauda sp. MAR_2010_75]